jgi:D-alanyl-D-alanine carboxypeptidase
MSIPSWLSAALDYIPRWLDYQMAMLEQPGAVLAVAHKGTIINEQAFGVANVTTGETLTPRHRFRVASHSKTFTAAGVMKLREAGKLSLDDRAGRYVAGLHDSVGQATIAQLLSHSAGITRDGPDGGQFAERKPFLSLAELKADLARPQPLGTSETFKYSNHGIALAGHIIEVVTGESYGTWITREVLAPLGLSETVPDMTMLSTPRPEFTMGHTTKLPYGQRLVVPGMAAGNAMAAATGFASTARDLVCFFGSLSPTAETSILSPASRREMSRRHWRDKYSGIERYYGLGTIIGPVGPWSWFGHSGGWPGTLSRTSVLPDHDITISILTNAVDGPSQPWMEGIIHILKTFEARGAPDSMSADWTGRWWGLWGASDLVPVGHGKVLVAVPAQPIPFFDATVIDVTGRDAGLVTEAQAFGDLGEPVRRERNPDGRVSEVWIGGKQQLGETAFTSEVQARYGAVSS